MVQFAGNSKSRLLWGNLPGSSVPKKFYFLLRCAHPAKAFSLKVARPLAETASRTPSEGLKSTVAKPLPETALRTPSEGIRAHSRPAASRNSLANTKRI